MNACSFNGYWFCDLVPSRMNWELRPPRNDRNAECGEAQINCWFLVSRQTAWRQRSASCIKRQRRQRKRGKTRVRQRWLSIAPSKWANFPYLLAHLKPFGSWLHCKICQQIFWFGKITASKVTRTGFILYKLFSYKNTTLFRLANLVWNFKIRQQPK